MNVSYAGRPFWSRAIVISAHIELAPSLTTGTVEHAIDLCTELHYVKAIPCVQSYAKRWSDRHALRLGELLETKLGQHA